MLAWRLTDAHSGVPADAALVPDEVEPEPAGAEEPDDDEEPDDVEVPDETVPVLELADPAGEEAVDDDTDDAAQPAVKTATASRGMASSSFFTRSPIEDQ
jgi:hypothetical protein